MSPSARSCAKCILGTTTRSTEQRTAASSARWSESPESESRERRRREKTLCVRRRRERHYVSAGRERRCASTIQIARRSVCCGNKIRPRGCISICAAFCRRPPFGGPWDGPGNRELSYIHCAQCTGMPAPLPSPDCSRQGFGQWRKGAPNFKLLFTLRTRFPARPRSGRRKPARFPQGEEPPAGGVPPLPSARRSERQKTVRFVWRDRGWELPIGETASARWHVRPENRRARKDFAFGRLPEPSCQTKPQILAGSVWQAEDATVRCPQGTKKHRYGNFSFHTPARVKSRLFFAPAFFPPSIQKEEKEVYYYLQMRGFYRCVWRLLLRMQGAGCSTTLSLLCTFYCALRFLL